MATIQVTVHQPQGIKRLQGETGSSLLQILRDNHISLFAPCGGNGICGKCRVRVKEMGVLTACTYYPESDIEILLPGSKESSVLTAQHALTYSVPIMPGHLAMQASYPLGLAVDIGTTTIAFYLVSLITASTLLTRGTLNPQSAYGADVISRIQHCSEGKGLFEMQQSVIKAINKQIAEMAAFAGTTPDQFVKIVIAGNTTMLHILAGVDPTPIALAPFTPAFTEKKIIPARELEINAADFAEVHLLPSISAYVGSDIVAGLASLNPPDSVRNYLFLDIGTNGEMALVCGDKITCCATAAGPAFEGAKISCGMGAVSGAISVFEGPGMFETIGNIAEPAGVCGSGLIDIVAYMVEHDVVNSDGNMEDHFPVYKTLQLNQQDIREVQLAKAAIRAGIEILLKEAGIGLNEIDALYLAGGFGNYISPESAMTIGLLPHEMAGKIIALGNTSGTGAVLSLKSELFETRINSILERTSYIELSTHDEFVMEFAMNMYFEKRPDQGL